MDTKLLSLVKVATVVKSNTEVSSDGTKVVERKKPEVSSAGTEKIQNRALKAATVANREAAKASPSKSEGFSDSDKRVVALADKMKTPGMREAVLKRHNISDPKIIAKAGPGAKHVRAAAGNAALRNLRNMNSLILRRAKGKLNERSFKAKARGTANKLAARKAEVDNPRAALGRQGLQAVRHMNEDIGYAAKKKFSPKFDKEMMDMSAHSMINSRLLMQQLKSGKKTDAFREFLRRHKLPGWRKKGKLMASPDKWRTA